MTDREKKIAEIREGYKSERDDNFTYKKEIVEQDIRFLLSELDRIKNIADDFNNDVFGLRMMLEEEREENQKLCEQLQSAQQDREKLIDALQTIRTDTEDPYTSEFAKKTLKQIGVNVE